MSSLFAQLRHRAAQPSSLLGRRLFCTTGKEAPASYGAALSWLHWGVGIPIVACVGCVMSAQQAARNGKSPDPKNPAKMIDDASKKECLGLGIGDWMFYHKSFGLLAGIFVAPRLAVRLSKQLSGSLPGHIPGTSGALGVLSSVAHYGLYGFAIAMPVTGVMMGYYGGKGLPFFYTTLPGAATTDGATAKWAFGWHKSIGMYGKFLIPVHFAGTGYHVVKGDAILARITAFAG